MLNYTIPVPHLTIAHSEPLLHVEKLLLEQVITIETWFRLKWQETPPAFTTSVDLRQAGYKLAPVDTNLFPAGFNNLNPDFLPLCVQAAQSVLFEYSPQCKNILLLPESHTRNQYYLKSLSVLRDILLKAGFRVRIGSLDERVQEEVRLEIEGNGTLLIEPLIRRADAVMLEGFEPCLLLLNNDLSTEIPPILQNLKQEILPSLELGWATRLKSSHFNFFDSVVDEFTQLVNVDPWLINSYFTSVDNIDFLTNEGVRELANEVDALLHKIQEKYQSYGISDQPFVVVKADNGTYGMSVMMVRDGEELKQLNRKQRTRMASRKGSQRVTKVILQEGVYSYEAMPNGAVAEPVVYMIGQFVVGGFYRVHQERGKDENLNAPGMHFEPLAFTEACNIPSNDLDPLECPNRFYAYGVIARLAALAAAREIEAVRKKT